MIYKIKYEYLLLFIALFSILLLNIIFNLYEQKNLCVDCENYLESAYLFYKTFDVHYYRPLGIALLYGLPIALGFENYSDIYIFIILYNIFFYLLIILLFFSISTYLFNRKKSFFLSLILISYFGISLHIFELLSEIPFLFFILFAFYHLTLYYKKNNINSLYFSLAILFFSSLIRPGILFFVFGILLFYFHTLLKTFTLKRFLPILFSFSLIFFQLIKMKNQYGDYTISYIDAVTYYNYLGSKALCLKENKILNQNTNKRAIYIYKQTFHEQKKIAYKDFWNQIKNNKYYLIRAYIDDIEENTKTGTSYLKFLKNINNSFFFPINIKIISEITEWQNKLTTLFGVLLSLYFILTFKKQDSLTLIFTCYFIYIYFVSGISSTQGDRFHIVFYPIIILLFSKFSEIYNTKKAVLNKNSLK